MYCSWCTLYFITLNKSHNLHHIVKKWRILLPFFLIFWKISSMTVMWKYAKKLIILSKILQTFLATWLYKSKNYVWGSQRRLNKVQKVPTPFKAFLCMSKYTNTQFKNGHRMKIGESGFTLCSGNKAPNILSATVPLCRMGSAPNKNQN
jgi:hypothetical protein